ncbi:MAG: carboxypeptidase regulatory-like domain-containing protein [Chthonomonas sp.]|nr:carboxypeptidase regulatory-like domain-containing protein [Chthonomonas sp.]
MKSPLWLLPLTSLLIAGCGSVVYENSTLSGRVADEDGQPVRDADVWTSDASTRSSVNGSYTLRGSRAGDINVFAETVQDGVTYRGRNMVRAVAEEAQYSCNIVVFPVNRLAEIRGTVRNDFGDPIVGARVFAYSDGYLTSASTVTDSDGRYSLDYLGGSVPYTVQAGAPGFSNDTGTVTLANGEERTVNFVLLDAGFPALPQVTGLSATTWVSPRFGNRGGPNPAGAYENIKRRWNPKRPTTTGRTSTFDNPIEVELNWDRLIGDDFYGYGIYRGMSSGSITDYDFYREPLSGTYIDTDTNLLPSSTYRYQVSALGTRFPDDPDSEGPRSAIAQARTLDDLTADAFTVGSNLEFSWDNLSGATSFVVYVFSDFPSVDLNSIWNNESSPVGGTGYSYNRIANLGGFVSGRTYYYIVLGLANSNASRTLSPVQSFVY